MKKKRFVFLDIDGPMIPSGCYLAYGHRASFERKFSPIAVACINRLCHETKANIVFNTTHNRDGESLLQDAVREGLKAGHISSQTPFTMYPTLEDRLLAIKQWLKEFAPDNCKWVSLDDCPIKDDNAILVDFDTGITPYHVNLAIEKLNKGNKILIL